jgi:carbonic anhydrase
MKRNGKCKIMDTVVTKFIDLLYKLRFKNILKHRILALKVVLFPKSHKVRFSVENSIYELLQMHFHWRGSEHRLNGHRFASELHLVHQNLNDSNKFAVIGFFFEVFYKSWSAIAKYYIKITKTMCFLSKATQITKIWNQ